MRNISAAVLVIASSFHSVQAACLDEATKFAERICGELKIRGAGSYVEANGELKADVSGIVRKVVGGGGASLNGKALADAYENVLRSDLAKELSDNRSCRREMAKVGVAQACKSVGETQPVTPQAYLDDSDLWIGMERAAFNAKMLGKTLNWATDDDGFYATYQTRYMGQPAVAKHYFNHDKLVRSVYLGKAVFTQGASWVRGEAGSEKDDNFANRLSLRSVRQLCEGFQGLPSTMLSKLGPPFEPEKQEKIDYRDFTLGQSTCQSPASCQVDGIARNDGYRRTLKFRLAGPILITMQVEEFLRGFYRKVYTDRMSSESHEGCWFSVIVRAV
jgi:hypothetical protein